MPGGRPSLYKPEYDKQAYKLTLLGFDDARMAKFFETSEQTLNAWKQKHPTFLEALRAGKYDADGDVAVGLYQRAKGYSWTEQQAVKVKTGPHSEKVVLVKVQKFVPPDTQAASLWLRNRQKDLWRDKTEVEVSDPLNMANEIRRARDRALGRVPVAEAAPDGRETTH